MDICFALVVDSRLLNIKKFFLCLFILERETERERGRDRERERERERERLKQAPGSELSAEWIAGLQLWNLEIMT